MSDVLDPACQSSDHRRHESEQAPKHLKGRAIAVAIVGTPLALSIGIPVGTMVSGVIGRRAAFLVLIGLSPLLALIGCVIFLNRKAGFA
ncbi:MULTISPECIES: hypothetical protein [unclassified Brevundimonas]|uniref:hypothetical protein n=1 Tax=unclassified Brevundimonas TaxID=2622653 RepID=UPI0028A7A010|nr:hypothetical protein [Brevundimonas sp.]